MSKTVDAVVFLSLGRYIKYEGTSVGKSVLSRVYLTRKSNRRMERLLRRPETPRDTSLHKTDTPTFLQVIRPFEKFVDSTNQPRSVLAYLSTSLLVFQIHVLYPYLPSLLLLLLLLLLPLLS